MSDVTSVAGIGSATAKILEEHGIKTAAALAAVALDKLTSIPGFSEARAKTAIAAAKTFVESGGAKIPGRATRKAVAKKTTATRKKTVTRSSAPAPAPAEQAEPAPESAKKNKQKKNKKDKKDKDTRSKNKKHKKNKKNKKNKK